MKKSLIFFLIFIIALFFDGFKVKSKTDISIKNYNYLSTYNFKDLISKKTLSNIKKICTDDICTYNLNYSYYFLIKKHIYNILRRISDDEIKETIILKGVKINRIYFKY